MTHILGRKPLTVCRGCGCDDLHACPGGCAWFVLDVPPPGEPVQSGVCSSCAVQMSLNPVLIDTVGTDAMDDVSLSIFAHLRCAQSWPPEPRLILKEAA
jgi:hypothetical protein